MGGIARRTFKAFYDDQMTHHAAALTYYALMSLFPAALLALSLLGLVGQYPATYDAILDYLRDVVPVALLEPLDSSLRSALQAKGTAATALAVSVVLALYGTTGVLEAARRALGRVPIGYTEALGRPALRAAIAAHYRHCYGLAVDPEQVVVTVGASGAFVLSFLAAFDPGDRVIVPEPAFPAYKNILQALGVEVAHLGLGPETAFKPTPELLETVPGPIAGLVIAMASPMSGMRARSWSSSATPW
jgi:hypothetical protein